MYCLPLWKIDALEDNIASCKETESNLSIIVCIKINMFLTLRDPIE